MMFFFLYVITIFGREASTYSTQINTYFTDSVCDDIYSDRHHCLYVPVFASDVTNVREIVTYCLTECLYLSSAIHGYNKNSSLTFEQLVQKNISSQQLYVWSAPIDLIENYQHYLDQPNHGQWTKNDGSNVFYNCTWPRFGPSCQYVFIHLSPDTVYLSLTDLVFDYYDSSDQSTTLTCYEHLKCYRGPSPLCLDWSEICDGKTDCIDGGQDEEHCWQLEVNECEEDEFRCDNGQCIPQESHGDHVYSIDCLDKSDELNLDPSSPIIWASNSPSIYYEDTSCPVERSFIGFARGIVCEPKYRQKVIDTIFSLRPSDLSEDCWIALLCRIDFQLLSSSISCSEYCKTGRCHQIIEETCHKSFYILPTVPLLFGHLFFAYSKTYLTNKKEKPSPEFICINEQFCKIIPLDNRTKQIENLTCHFAQNLHYLIHPLVSGPWIDKFLAPAYRRYHSCAALSDDYYDFCYQHPHLYRCVNTSKCISPHRLLDSIEDCFFGDDEQMNFVSKFIRLANNSAFFHCSSSNTFISSRLVADGICHCPKETNKPCDDEYTDLDFSQTHISFQTICDGFTELKPLNIYGQWLTDETDCQHWLCDNVYTRCDKIWNCLDGRDEANCNQALPLSIECPSNSRSCVLSGTNELICISIEKMNDSHVDCLGATDEPLLCRLDENYQKRDRFYCINDTNRPCIEAVSLCKGRKSCLHGDDEQFCQKNKSTTGRPLICTLSNMKTMIPAEKHFCERFTQNKKALIIPFTVIDRSINLEQIGMANDHGIVVSKSMAPKAKVKRYKKQCNRGLDLRFWSNSLESNTTAIACLCPPSYYGQYCQYQNQRVTVTLQFRALSDAWQTTFVIVALLIDHTHERAIHSVQQLTYLPFRDCQIRFSFYLLFSTRSRNATLNYSVHFDIFEQQSHQHRASYLAPIIFPFLPVYRLALQLDIPRPQTQQTCSDLDCGNHGRCLQYTRMFHSSWMASFCQCDQGWSGRLCTIPITCSCSSQARCLGTLMNSNRSICLCPSNKFGPRCYLSNDYICDNDLFGPTCLHGGRCIPRDQYQLQLYPAFTCQCARGFTGDRCEQQQTQLIISFEPTLIDDLPQSMLVHFIRSYPDRRHENSTTFKLIPFNFSAVSLFWPHPFHVVFVEFHRHQYYLAFIRPVFDHSEVKMETTIRSSDRCPHIRELFPSKLMQSHHLYRIKFYHQLCQSNNTFDYISCFYDDLHFCLCQSSPRNGDKREANCLEYNHDQKFDCLGQNGCENGGQCFQDNPTCPQTSICICAECSYGRRCQFSMNGFRLTLDAILGYHIEPHFSLLKQPSIIQVAFGLTFAMVVIGGINGILVFITFKRKKVCQVGCGYYFLISSITTLLTMTLFSIKFMILLTTQMGLLTNRSFLLFQCRSVDYLLRSCLNLDQWLNACVSLERAFTILYGIKFDKAKSRQSAKFVIMGLTFMIFISGVYDPIYQKLINDSLSGSTNEPDRIWCFVSHPKWIKRLDSFMHPFLFFVPFFINITSAVIIIRQSATNRWKTHQNLRLGAVVTQQVRQHKHILIGPMALVIVAIPRFVLSIVSGCMKWSSRSHIYLVSYFISFAPVMLTSVLFIIPSKHYRRELQKSLSIYYFMFRNLFVRFQRLTSLQN